MLRVMVGKMLLQTAQRPELPRVRSDGDDLYLHRGRNRHDVDFRRSDAGINDPRRHYTLNNGGITMTLDNQSKTGSYTFDGNNRVTIETDKVRTVLTRA